MSSMSRVGYVVFCLNMGGLFFKVKYFWLIDSELVLWGKGEKNFGEGSEKEFEIVYV